MKEENRKKLKKERFQLLRRIDHFFEIPMVVLGFLWIVLLVFELLNKSNRVLEKVSIGIWIIFIIDFAIKFIIAPEKIKFLKANIITIISLIIPAFRLLSIFRLTRLLKFTRGVVFVKLVGGMNNGMRALARTMEKRAFGYVVIFTIFVMFTSSAAIYVFERKVNPGIENFGSAVWWTVMIITTLGSESWPISTEGRILCSLLAIYGVTVFGYIAATFATFFIDEDAVSDKSEIATSKEIESLKKEVQELKEIMLRYSIRDPQNK